ncbi:TPA: hypothetical protein NJV65_002587 [Corynebacterium striatum]|nr:hypothetical protein [Corynebacterium striatum]HCG3143554.1 hypothetical protein [Corynebacterium striatum]HCG3164986.1 hypothetical protein [Corynebacterium striatum]
MPPTVIDAMCGSVCVESFVDSTPGDEFVAVSLAIDGVQVDLNAVQARRLGDALRLHSGVFASAPNES